MKIKTTHMHNLNYKKNRKKNLGSETMPKGALHF